MKNEKANKLIKKYLTDSCSSKELAMIESWYIKAAEYEPDEPGDPDYQYIELEILQKLRAEQLSAKPKKLWPKITAAAALILIALSFGLYFYSGTDHTTQYVIRNTRQDIAPGGNKAILTLANGRKISLIDANRGELAEQSGIRITKAADGQLIYTVLALSPSGGDAEGRGGFNTIETPKGGQYQVILPDGTKAWLNAASTLKYPVQFSKKVRRVELKGEAYFEVSSLKSATGDRVPFFVNTSTQTVEVLGTHFNINSYEDEEAVKTTLIEGSVRVIVNSDAVGKPGRIDEAVQNAGIVLKPNQQSFLKGNYFNVKQVNTEESIAWKNGYFSFTHADLQTVMRQLARWYDVDVEYGGEIPSGTFTGKVYRDMNLSKVLEILTYAQVNFRIEGKKLTIFP